MRRLLILVCLCLTLTVSAQQWYFWIDAYQPAQRDVLHNSRQVMLVNNTLVQPNDFGHSILMDGHSVGNEKVDLANAALHCLFTATQTLESHMEYDRVELIDKSQNTSTNYYAQKPLSAQQMHTICTQYAVDAVVVLNQLVLYDIIESFPTEGSYYAYLQAYAQSHWTVYHSATKRTSSFAYADTLLWESQLASTRNNALAQLPSRQDALLYLASEVGSAIAEELTPQWVSVRRYLYENTHPQLQAGLKAFRYQKWQEAIGCWQEVLRGEGDEVIRREVKGKEYKKAAACAAANIAIAYEMLGDYALACDYAQRAIRLFGAWKTAYGRQQQVNIRYYLAQLQARQVGERAL